METRSDYLLFWQVDLGRRVPVKEVHYYTLYSSVVVRVGKVAKNIDVYVFCSQLTTKRRKYIYTVTVPFMQMWQNIKIANFMCQLYSYKSSFLDSYQIVRYLCQTICLYIKFFFCIHIKFPDIHVKTSFPYHCIYACIKPTLSYLAKKIHVKFYKSRKPGAEHFKKEEKVWEPAVQ